MVLVLALDVHAVAHVDMAVEEVLGLVGVDDLQEALEAPVGKVVAVAHPLGGRVGQDDVHAAVFGDLPFELSDAAAHLLFGVLVGAGAVFPAAAQTQDPQTPVFHDVAVDAVAALGGLLLVAGVVVAVNVHHRGPRHGDDEAQVRGVQVAGGEDQVILLQRSGTVHVP